MAKGKKPNPFADGDKDDMKDPKGKKGKKPMKNPFPPKKK
jgi:hypothetical protein